MNERIRKLAERAGFSYMPSDSPDMADLYKCADFEIEKFAELIVGECAKAFEAEVDTWKEMSPYQGSIKRQGTKAIKQHFGVE